MRNKPTLAVGRDWEIAKKRKLRPGPLLPAFFNPGNDLVKILRKPLLAFFGIILYLHGWPAG